MKKSNKIRQDIEGIGVITYGSFIAFMILAAFLILGGVGGLISGDLRGLLFILFGVGLGYGAIWFARH